MTRWLSGGSDHRSVSGSGGYLARRPPAKFSVIAEHVWLLQKTGAPLTLLVFGNDRPVPELWLARYGALGSGVDFFYLSDDGVLERLNR